MTTDRKDYVGLSTNKCTFIGKITEDPEFVENGEEEIAFMKLRTMIKIQSANGQWVDHEQFIPLTVMDGNRVAKLVKPYVHAGRQLLVEGYYQTWEDEGVAQHAFITTSIILGSKPMENKAGSSDTGPSLPPD